MYKCPSCGGSGNLMVEARVDAQINAAGQLDCMCNNLTFEPHSRMDCGVCGHHGCAHTFEYPDPPPEHAQFGMTEQGWGEFLGRLGIEEADDADLNPDQPPF